MSATFRRAEHFNLGIYRKTSRRVGGADELNFVYSGASADAPVAERMAETGGSRIKSCAGPRRCIFQSRRERSIHLVNK